MDKKVAEILNNEGLEKFSSGDLENAYELLKRSYKNWSDERGILINLGLCYMQRGNAKAAEKCYELALYSEDLRTRRAANKNIGLLYLWKNEWKKGWYHYSKRYEGQQFEINQWQGEELKGKPLLIWNDVGMGDAFNFARYTKVLKDRGEKIILAVDKSQIEIFRKKLAWKIDKVIDRDSVMPPPREYNHVPLMTLIGIIDPTTKYGRNWTGSTWNKEDINIRKGIGICWSSNRNDRSMHIYKSTNIQNILSRTISMTKKEIISLQTDEEDDHRTHGLIQAKEIG